MNRAVVAYVVRDGLLLSVSRKDTGQHAVPGGKVEDGKTEIQGLARELDEETGLVLIAYQHVFTGVHNSGRPVSAYIAVTAGEPVAREPGTSVAWVTPEALANGFAAAYHSRALRAAGLL